MLSLAMLEMISGWIICLVLLGHTTFIMPELISMFL
jgi:hypothetical protein